MSTFTLVRQQTAPVQQQDKETALRVLFGAVDGLGEVNRKAWRRFMRGLLRLEPGEMAEVSTRRERTGWYHRKHMKLESRLFEEQERFLNFEQFRNWLKVGAGFCDWVPGPKGAVIPVPRSISYSTLEQGEMEQFHADMLEFLRTEHAAKVLWPKLPALQRVEAVEAVLSEFGRFAE